MANSVFLYDDACPMCKGYTGTFSALNWSGRLPFSKIKTGDYPELDLDRGRHEIPLLNAVTGEVRYGLDAMTTVVSEALPLVKPLVRNRYFLTGLKPLYNLITYNRRVIAGTKSPLTGFDCAPDYHVMWRIAYLGVAGLLILLIGWPNIIIGATFGFALLLGLIISRDRLSFLGHWVTVLVMVALVEGVLPMEGIGSTLASFVGGWESLRRIG